MRNVGDSSARKRQKLGTKVQSTATTAAKMLTLLQTKVEEQEQKEQTVKNASEILQKFRTSVKDANILTSDMCEEDILLVVSATFGHSFLNLLGKLLNHIPPHFPGFIGKIKTILKANSSASESDESYLEMVIRAVQKCGNFLKTQTEDFFQNSLWTASNETGQPFLNVQMPQIDKCSVCGSLELYPCQETFVTFYTLTGPFPGMKCMLRCKECQTYHHLDGYTPPNEGKAFYAKKMRWIGASNKVFFERNLHELLCENGNHAFVSHQAFAEIYNAVFLENTSLGQQFSNWLKTYGDHSRYFQSGSMEDSACQVLLTDADDVLQPVPEHPVKSSSEDGLLPSMTRKNVSSAYFNGELWNELLEKNLTSTFKISNTSTRESVMRELDSMRKQELYPHPDCTDECKKKGCENLRVIDSCWKVCMCHCMFAVPMEVDGFPSLSFPNVCTNEPKVGSVFCEEHFSLLTRNGVPTRKEDFLKFIGCTGKPKSEKDIKTVDQKLTAFAERLYQQDGQAGGVSALTYQGTNGIVSSMKAHAFEEDISGPVEKCNKDTGEKARLRQRSRGHFICVTGGGHITYFDPIFKSESPSQIYMQVVRLLYLEFKDVPQDKLEDTIKNYVLCYDNMCQLDSLKASKEDLPFPPPLNTMWRDIQKIIDRLHLQNHKQDKCKELYNPDKVLPEGYNTMVAEQTFAWFSRFKKIANSMSQTHHLFYIHRNIKRRNAYSSRCRQRGKEPLLPGINTNLSKN